MKPTLAGYLAFIRNIMGIQVDVLPDDAAIIALSFALSLEIVNIAIAQASALIYSQAVYNLAGSTLIQFAPDQGEKTFFKDLRTLYNINAFAAGVVQSAADVSTSATLVIPEAMKELTFANLQQLKDPWGRQYLAYAQDYGPSVWGLS